MEKQFIGILILSVMHVCLGGSLTETGTADTGTTFARKLSEESILTSRGELNMTVVEQAKHRGSLQGQIQREHAKLLMRTPSACRDPQILKTDKLCVLLQSGCLCSRDVTNQMVFEAARSKSCGREFFNMKFSCFGMRLVQFFTELQTAQNSSLKAFILESKHYLPLLPCDILAGIFKRLDFSLQEIKNIVTCEKTCPAMKFTIMKRMMNLLGNSPADSEVCAMSECVTKMLGPYGQLLISKVSDTTCVSNLSAKVLDAGRREKHEEAERRQASGPPDRAQAARDEIRKKRLSPEELSSLNRLRPISGQSEEVQKTVVEATAGAMGSDELRQLSTTVLCNLDSYESLGADAARIVAVRCPNNASPLLKIRKTAEEVKAEMENADLANLKAGQRDFKENVDKINIHVFKKLAEVAQTQLSNNDYAALQDEGVIRDMAIPVQKIGDATVRRKLNTAELKRAYCEEQAMMPPEGDTYQGQKNKLKFCLEESDVPVDQLNTLLGSLLTTQIDTMDNNTFHGALSVMMNKVSKSLRRHLVNRLKTERNGFSNFLTEDFMAMAGGCTVLDSTELSAIESNADAGAGLGECVRAAQDRMDHCKLSACDDADEVTAADVETAVSGMLPGFLRHLDATTTAASGSARKKRAVAAGSITCVALSTLSASSYSAGDLQTGLADSVFTSCPTLLNVDGYNSTKLAMVAEKAMAVIGSDVATWNASFVKDIGVVNLGLTTADINKLNLSGIAIANAIGLRTAILNDNTQYTSMYNRWAVDNSLSSAASLTHQQLQQLGRLLCGIPDAEIAQISTTNYGYATSQIGMLGCMTQGQASRWAQLAKTQYNITEGNANLTSVADIGTIGAAMAGMGPLILKRLTLDQISHIPADAFAIMPGSDLTQLSDAQLGSLSVAQAKAITSLHRNSLTSSQLAIIDAIIATAASSMTTIAGNQITQAASGGGATQAPSGGGATQAPSGGGATQAPSVGGATQAPSVGGATQAQSGGGATQAPSGSSATQAPSMSGATQAQSGGGATQAQSGGGATQAPSGGSATQAAQRNDNDTSIGDNDGDNSTENGTHSENNDLGGSTTKSSNSNGSGTTKTNTPTTTTPTTTTRQTDTTTKALPGVIDSSNYQQYQGQLANVPPAELVAKVSGTLMTKQTGAGLVQTLRSPAAKQALLAKAATYIDGMVAGTNPFSANYLAAFGGDIPQRAVNKLTNTQVANVIQSLGQYSSPTAGSTYSVRASSILSTATAADLAKKLGEVKNVLGGVSPKALTTALATTLLGDTLLTVIGSASITKQQGRIIAQKYLTDNSIDLATKTKDELKVLMDKMPQTARVQIRSSKFNNIATGAAIKLLPVMKGGGAHDRSQDYSENNLFRKPLTLTLFDKAKADSGSLTNLTTADLMTMLDTGAFSIKNIEQVKAKLCALDGATFAAYRMYSGAGARIYELCKSTWGAVSYTTMARYLNLFAYMSASEILALDTTQVGFTTLISNMCGSHPFYSRAQINALAGVVNKRLNTAGVNDKSSATILGGSYGCVLPYLSVTFLETLNDLIKPDLCRYMSCLHYGRLSSVDQSNIIDFCLPHLSCRELACQDFPMMSGGLVSALTASQVTNNITCAKVATCYDVLQTRVQGCDARAAIYSCLKTSKPVNTAQNLAGYLTLCDQFTDADWLTITHANMCGLLKQAAKAWNAQSQYAQQRQNDGYRSHKCFGNTPGRVKCQAKFKAAASSVTCNPVIAKRRRRATSSTAYTCTELQALGGAGVRALTPAQLGSIADAEFASCAGMLGQTHNLSVSQWEALANKGKNLWGSSPASWTADHIRTAGGIVSGLMSTEIDKLDLSDVDAASAAGSNGNWTVPAKLTALWRQFKKDHLNDMLANLTASQLRTMGQLPCGIPAADIATIPTAVYCDASNELGLLSTCEASQLQQWATHALHTTCYGSNVATWQRSSSIAVGSVIGGLPKTDLAKLSETQIQMIPPWTVAKIPPGAFSGFTVGQLGFFSQNQATAVTQTQRASLDTAKLAKIKQQMGTAVADEGDPTIVGGTGGNNGCGILEASVMLTIPAIMAVVLRI